MHRKFPKNSTFKQKSRSLFKMSANPSSQKLHYRKLQTKDEEKRPGRRAFWETLRTKAGAHPADGTSGDWKIAPNCQIESGANKPYYKVKDLDSSSYTHVERTRSPTKRSGIVCLFLSLRLKKIYYSVQHLFMQTCLETLHHVDTDSKCLA